MIAGKIYQESPKSGKKSEIKTQEEAQKQTKQRLLQRNNPTNTNNVYSQQNLLRSCEQKIKNVVQQLIELIIRQTQITQKFKVKSIEQDLLKIKIQLGNSQKKIQYLEDEGNIARKKQRQYAIALTEKDKQIQAYKDQQSQWKRQLAEKQELISSMNQKDADKQKQISRLTAEKAELKNDLLKTKKNHASLEQKYTDLEAQKAGLAQEIRLNQIRNSKLFIEIHLLKDQLDQIQHQKLQLQQQLKGKEQTITNLQTAAQDLQKLYDKDKFEWSEQRKKMGKQIESLESLNKKLKKDIDANNLSLEEVKGVLEETKKQFELKLNEEKLYHFKELQECEQKHKQQTVRLTQSKDKQIEEIQNTHQLQIGNLTDQSTQLQQEKLKIESQLAERTKKIAQIQHQKLQLQQRLKGKEQAITNCQASMKYLQELYSKDKFEWSEQREKMTKQIESLELFNRQLEKNVTSQFHQNVQCILQQTKEQFKQKLKWEKLKYFKDQQK